MISDAKNRDFSAVALRTDGPSTPASRRFSSIGDARHDPHLNGHYLRHNPTWHVEFSPWKANNIHRLLQRMQLSPRTIAEVGCGAGEVLRQLQLKMDPACRFWGCDVAPAAIELAKQRQNERLSFEVCDFTAVETPRTDLLLVLEVIDHVEDYLGFLRAIRSRAEWKLFSFSLDISMQSALRKGALLRRKEVHSHIHHFNKELALAAVRDTGYEIVHHEYPPMFAYSRLAKLAKPIRQVAFKLNPDLTARALGGYSLMILAR
ncbi:MAG TPA: class I SAM-dependent methyltransferase [Bryobacteraceae bacterium]|nr:class I SAM-dependent methyltransferase [Bryobacteraceae bacterium]